MKAVIAAGGHGSRLRPITWTLNKHLIPLANEPMIFNALKKIADVGITEVAINVNPGDKEIEEACGDGSLWGLNIKYIEQEGGAVGIGQILYSAREWINGEDVLFYLGDNVVLGSLKGLMDKFYEKNLDACFAFVEIDDPSRFGVAEFSDAGDLISIVEKPKVPPSNFAQTGLYIYKMSKYLKAFKNIDPSERGEYEITDINTYIIKNGRVGFGNMVGWWKDTGTPEALLEGNQLLLNEMTIDETIIDDSVVVGENVVIQGNVKIGGNSVISDGVLIRGPVVIGEDVKVTNAFIGPHTTIGDRCVVNGADVEHSIIMEDAVIDVDNRIVDSIIGRNVRIYSKSSSRPYGHTLVIGENSYAEL